MKLEGLLLILIFNILLSLLWFNCTVFGLCLRFFGFETRDVLRGEVVTPLPNP